MSSLLSITWSMTNKLGRRSTYYTYWSATNSEEEPLAQRLSRIDVVRAALRLLDEEGTDAVTLRGVARALGVHLNSVSLQVGSKARLLDHELERRKKAEQRLADAVESLLRGV